MTITFINCVGGGFASFGLRWTTGFIGATRAVSGIRLFP